MKTPNPQHLLVAIFFCLITLSLNAQQFSTAVSSEVNFSPPSKIYSYGSFYVSMEKSDPPLHTGFKFNLHKYKYHYKLFFQDRTMRMVKELKLSKGERVYGPFFSSLRTINNKLYFVYFNMVADDDKGPIRLMASEIDTVSLDLKPAKELLTLDFKNSNSKFTFGNISLYDELEIFETPNSSQTLVAFSAGTNNLYFYSVLDNQLNQLWKKEGKIEAPPAIRMQGAVMDNKGNVYLSFKGMDGNELENGHIIISNKKGLDKDVIVNIVDGKAFQVNLTASKKEDVVKVTGTYKAASYTLHGAYNALITAGEAGLRQLQLTPFTPELLKELDHDDWSALKPKNMGTCACIDMTSLELQNGEMDMVGMFRRTVFTQKYSYIQTGDIIIVHFKNGKATFGRIPKYRVSAGSTIGDSFKALAYKNETVIFYNDNEKNLEKDIKKDASNSNVYKNVVLVAATAANGQIVNRQVVVDLKTENGMVVPDWISETTDETVVAPVLKVKSFGGIDKTSKFATISMK